MLCVKVWGRGGEGVVKAAEILAKAIFIEGKSVQFIPFFGFERRGAPVTAYVKISDEPIRILGLSDNFDYLVVLNPLFLKRNDVVEGLTRGGFIVANTSRGFEDLPFEGFKLATIDATGIALRNGLVLGGLPIINTIVLGGMAKATGIVSLENLKRVIKEEWSGTLRKINLKAVVMGEANIKEWR